MDSRCAHWHRNCRVLLTCAGDAGGELHLHALLDLRGALRDLLYVLDARRRRYLPMCAGQRLLHHAARSRPELDRSIAAWTLLCCTHVGLLRRVSSIRHSHVPHLLCGGCTCCSCVSVMKRRATCHSSRAEAAEVLIFCPLERRDTDAPLLRVSLTLSATWAACTACV